jgi:hypothetical protein
MRGGVRTYIYCQPPAGGRIRFQGNKMRRLEYRILYRVKDSRRRNHEWAEGWVDGLARERARGEYCASTGL